MKSPSGSFLGHLSVNVHQFAQGRCWDVFQYWATFIYQIPGTLKIWYSILSLLSQSRFFYPVLSFCREIPSESSCFVLSPFSVSSQTLDRTWLNTISIRSSFYWAHTAVCSTHCLLCVCIPAVLLSSQTLQHRRSGNVRPGLSLRMQLADDRFFFVSKSQQHSLAGTQQCA